MVRRLRSGGSGSIGGSVEVGAGGRLERLSGDVGVAVWARLEGLNCSTVGSPLGSLSRVVMSTSESTTGVPSMCFALFLNVFPCVFEVWEDLVLDPLRGSMMGGVGAGWSGSLESLEDEGTFIRSVESSARSLLKIVLSISVPIHGWVFLSYLTL